MFSVVIPLYNKEGCIVKTLDSVLAQSFDDFEVIVVDDGSTDGSVAFVKAVQDPRIKLISQKNGGPSSARNTGIRAAQGEMVAFIDADDIWMPDYLREMNSLIEEYPDAVIFGMNYGVIKGNRKVCEETASYRGYLDGSWRSFPFFFWTSSTSCRRSELVRLGGFDERMMYGEDCDMWYRLLLEGKGAIDSRVFAYYNKDVDNSLTWYNMPLEKHIPFFMDKYADVRKNDAGFRRFFDEQMVYRLYPYLFEKKYRKTARQLAGKLDYSQLKRSMRFRMKYPYLYRFLRSFKASF